MAQAKRASKQKRSRSKAVPVLGLAGLSMTLAGGASASTWRPGHRRAVGPDSGPRQEIFLGEEEISDVSLSTFYVFDKENAAQPQANQKTAWWGRPPWLPLWRLPLRLRWLRLGRLPLLG